MRFELRITIFLNRVDKIVQNTFFVLCECNDLKNHDTHYFSFRKATIALAKASDIEVLP
jgi:hypothetical protein